MHLLRALPDHAQSNRAHSRAGQAARVIRQHHFTPVHIHRDARQRVDHGNRVRPRFFGGQRVFRDIGYIRSQLDDQRLLGRRLDRLGDGVNAFRLHAEGHAAFTHIRAGNVHFQQVHARARQPLGHLHILLHARARDVGDHGDVFRQQPRQVVFNKALHAGVLQADAVEHAARRFRNAGRRVARARQQAQALDGNAAQLADVIQFVIFPAKTECSARRNNRVFELHAAQIEGKISHADTPPSRRIPGHPCRRACSASCRPPA